MPKTKSILIANIYEDRILQLSNDLSEGIESGTVQEWRAVTKYFRNEFDKLFNETRHLRALAVELSVAESLRAHALPELLTWVKKQQEQDRKAACAKKII